MRFNFRFLWIAGMTVSMVGLIYYSDIRPLTLTQQQLETSIKTLQTQIKYLELSQPQNTLKTDEVPTLLENISRIGLEHGLELHTITPSKLVHKAFYDAISIELIATGTYDAIAHFIKEISCLPTWVLIHSFRLTTNPEKTFNMVLSVKIYPNLPLRHKQDSFFKKKSLKHSTLNLHIPEPLEAYPLEMLQMVGFLRKKNARLAIIRVASDGSIHVVRVGNYLGKETGRVVDITDTEVRVVVQEHPVSLPLKASQEAQ